MASRIPTSTSVTESAVISAPFGAVWHHIKLASFPNFWTALSKAEPVHGASSDTDIVKWTFKDGTELEVKLEAHSAIDHYITYSVISAKPQLSYSSVVSTIRLFPITSGHHEGQTFIQWSGNFSSDADAGVIEDAKFKRREALADLAKLVKK
ncbi:Bet v1-like protein [Hyaloscypha hepaticicola]|uniref:Bet v1-like protein n=1 Tax=Hyaloscypha hepaticicola TaxID=2082293 RepID=A0A2J6PSH5_9HELO|nr:Bet v1-like protein [Hyaloscypha hepaticicola]